MSEVYPEGPSQGNPNNPDPNSTPADTPQAPEPAEPKPTPVEPADQSAPKTDTVLGKDYEVTKDAGYREVQPPAPEDSSDSES